jgi:hypothetical protein
MPRVSGEDPLGDPKGEAGGCFREVLLKPHLAFEVGEDALDHEPEGGECSLAVDVGGGARAVGSEERDAVGGKPVAVGATSRG